MTNHRPVWIHGNISGTARLVPNKQSEKDAASIPVKISLDINSRICKIFISREEDKEFYCYNNLLFGKIFEIETDTEDIELNCTSIKFKEVSHPKSNYDWEDTEFQFYLDEEITVKHKNKSWFAVLYKLPNAFRLHEETGQIEISEHHKINFCIEELPDHQPCLAVWSNAPWNEKLRDRVALAIELIQGAPIQLIQCIEGEEHTFFSLGESIQTSHESVYINPVTTEIVQNLIQQFQGMSEKFFENFRIACKHLLYAKTIPVIEIKYTTAMVWIEIMDEKDRLDIGEIKNLLQINRESAEFLKEIRNKLIHESGSMPKAIEVAFCKTRRIYRSKEDRDEVRLNPNLKLSEQQHLDRIQSGLGLKHPPLDKQHSYQLAFRLVERIETAIWTFLGIPRHQIKRRPIVEWHGQGEAPVPTVPDSFRLQLKPRKH